MTRWTYYNGRRRYLLSAEASERMDAQSRQIWVSFDKLFEVARNEVREGAPPRRSRLERFREWLRGPFP